MLNFSSPLKSHIDLRRSVIGRLAGGQWIGLAIIMCKLYCNNINASICCQSNETRHQVCDIVCVCVYRLVHMI